MSASALLPLDDALALIREHVAVLPEQRVPLAEALGLELRQDVVADMDQPPFDRSAMDGFAVAGEGSDFEIMGELQPGEMPTVSLNEGQALRVFTGAQIPEGATRVIMQELTQVEGKTLHETERSNANFIRRKGEDAPKGKVLIKSGALIGATEASVMASVGVTRPLVQPIPRVVHFTTGNELVPPDEPPGLNQIRDSNTTLMAGLLTHSLGDLIHQEHLRDELETAVVRCQAIETKQDYDLMLLSGGASVGRYDIGKPLLERLGYTIHFTKLDLRPGKPLVFATRQKDDRTQVAFILPGNPVSHFVCYKVVISLALQKMVWDLEPVLALNHGFLSEDFAYKPSDRLTFWPGHGLIQDGEWQLRALPWQSSGDLQALLPANVLIQIKSMEKLIPSGTEVRMLHHFNPNVPTRKRRHA